MNKKTAALYLRCSTPSQVKGHSLIRQLAYCKLWCEDNNVTVSEIIADVGSGYGGYHLQEFKSAKRGNLGRFLSGLRLCDDKPDYLVYELTDRLSRDAYSYIEIRDTLKMFGVVDKCAGMDYSVDHSYTLSDYEKQMTYR